jgi:hypothetical protein
MICRYSYEVVAHTYIMTENGKLGMRSKVRVSENENILSTFIYFNCEINFVSLQKSPMNPSAHLSIDSSVRTLYHIFTYCLLYMFVCHMQCMWIACLWMYWNWASGRNALSFEGVTGSYLDWLPVIYQECANIRKDTLWSATSHECEFEVNKETCQLVWTEHQIQVLFHLSCSSI